MLNNVFGNLLPIFLIALLGSVIRRKWLTSDEFWRGLEKLSFYILFPMVLFTYSSKVDLDSYKFYDVLIALITSNLLVSAFLIRYQLSKNYDNVIFTSIFQGSTRYNSYIFFAVGAALFGEKGLSIVASISPYLIVYTNISAVTSFAYYVQKNDDKSRKFILVIRSIIANPLIFSSILGISFNYFNLILSPGITQTIHNLADSALTMGILIVGAGIKFKIKKEHFQVVIFSSIIKLVIMPIVTFVVLWSMSISGIDRSIAILFSCLPCASSSYVLSRQLGGDPETMSSIITFSTIFSILTISAMMYILG